jgi:hypothetical protein
MGKYFLLKGKNDKQAVLRAARNATGGSPQLIKNLLKTGSKKVWWQGSIKSVKSIDKSAFERIAKKGKTIKRNQRGFRLVRTR